MSRPRLLDLFCGAGGAAMGYHRAGFEVVGVDIEPQPHYPFAFRQEDALTILYYLNHNGGSRYAWPDGTGALLTLRDFSAIHASPPCQRYSTMTGVARDRHPDLIGPVRDALMQTGLPWVIENVPQAPLHDPVTLCGSAFGLRVRRHRAFESSHVIVGTQHYHREQGQPVGVYGQHPDRRAYLRPDGTQRGAKATSVGHAQRAMGIDWMDWPELAESIPPAYCEFIGRQLLDLLRDAGGHFGDSSHEHTPDTASSPDALDLACSLLDDARHAASGGRTKLAAALNPILFGESASRLVREWEQRKKSARDITPAHVLIHQHNQQRGTT